MRLELVLRSNFQDLHRTLQGFLRGLPTLQPLVLHCLLLTCAHLLPAVLSDDVAAHDVVILRDLLDDG